MPHYTYTVEGRDSTGTRYTITGHISAQEGGFPLVTTEALRQAFMQLTQGKAVYGQPGVGCVGPYTTLKLTVELAQD